MKKYNKYLIIIFLLAFALFQGCESLDLEKLNTPNALGPDQADPALLFNHIQNDYRDGVTNFNDIGGELSRIENMFGRVYYSNYPGSRLNNPWNNLYSGMLPDIAAIENLNTDGSFNYLVGASKAMEAHLLMLFVDYIGDAVYTEANDAADFPTPQLDDGASIYQSALSLLDEAKTLLQGSTLGAATDFYYQGDADKWIKFINTLKMRAALTTGDYQAVVNATNVITSNDDNMVYEYGTNESTPDTRHPDYKSDYSAQGAGNYRSNWLMNLMVGKYGDLSSSGNDPRRRYYFYRQIEATPGSYGVYYLDCGGCSDEGYYLYQPGEDAQTLVCSVQTTPTHLQFTPDEDYWCTMRMGYWGRTHGNAEGIPPDNFQRTASGVYPAGGRFDDNPDIFLYDAVNGVVHWWTAKVGPGLGAGGQGIEPIICSSYVEFWKAEAYLALNDATNATTHFQNGIVQSIAYVTSFGARDTKADLSYAPDATEIGDFVNEMTSEFEDAPMTTPLDGFGWPRDASGNMNKDKMDILGEQFFIAMYGGAADAFNFIRRTGYPRTLARPIDENSGPFPRTLLYPSDESGTNPNVTQRQDNSTKVFWDTGITNPAN